VRLGQSSTLSAELVERIVRERREGATLTAIAESLTADGVPTAQGGKWWPATGRKVLSGQDASTLAS
jgi:hypothetical protein